MSFTYPVHVFCELLQRYSTPEAFRAYLESEEGGSLVFHESEDKLMWLIHYDKGHYIDLPHVPWFRSVVWDKVNHRPLSVAPRKVCGDEEWREWREWWKEPQDIVLEEYLDGFMIQCFRKEGIIHKTSRSRWDATGTFYSLDTLGEMFLDAYSMEQVEHDLGEATYVSYLVKHPHHRVVTPCHESQVYLIHRGVVDSTGKVRIEDHLQDYGLPVPNDQQTLGEWVNQLCRERTWAFQGVVIKDRHGNRWRMRSETYQAIRVLRGNHRSPLERYSQLATQNLTDIYLTYYPEDTLPFLAFMKVLFESVKLLHTMYRNIYIWKEGSLKEMPSWSRSHLYALHGIYLEKLRSQKKYITPPMIHEYLLSQPWQRLSHVLRSIIRFLAQHQLEESEQA